MSRVKDQAFRAGWEARMNGRPQSACPHYKEVPRYAWLGGWDAADEQVTKPFVVWGREGEKPGLSGYIRLLADGRHQWTNDPESASKFDTRMQAEEVAGRLRAAGITVEVRPSSRLWKE